MPRRDGTGPEGAGIGTGIGRFFRRKGGGIGRMGGPMSAGPGGYCVCPKCGEKVSHERTEPCFTKKCPKCGTRMTRG